MGYTAGKTPVIQRRTVCRLCPSTSLDLVLALTPTPLANSLVTAEMVSVVEPCFPLDVFACRACGHVQLLDVVDPEVLFRNYLYTSGASPVYIDYLKDYASKTISDFRIGRDDLVVEIGSNDGTLLRHFKERGMRVLGVDPARNLTEIARQAGVETISEFFTSDLARQIKDDRGTARLIIANHVFAHADDLAAVVRGVRQLLAPDGIFAFEVSYLLEVYRKVLFDTIYHEHLSYHAVGPLVGFFAHQGMELIDTQQVTHQGGSLRCMVQFAGGPWPKNPSVQSLISQELQELGTDLPATFRRFGERIERERQRLTCLLAKIRAKGQHIAGYGAPAKTTTLMYHFGLDAKQLEFIGDDSPIKQGMFTPGLHIPIVPSEEIYKRKPDYLLVLAWNFADSIIARHKAFSQAGGKFIVPLPTLRTC